MYASDNQKATMKIDMTTCDRMSASSLFIRAAIEATASEHSSWKSIESKITRVLWTNLLCPKHLICHLLFHSWLQKLVEGGRQDVVLGRLLHQANCAVTLEKIQEATKNLNLWLQKKTVAQRYCSQMRKLKIYDSRVSMFHPNSRKTVSYMLEDFFTKLIKQLLSKDTFPHMFHLFHS